MSTNLIKILLAMLLTIVKAMQVSYNFHPGALEIIDQFLPSEAREQVLSHGCWCSKLDPDNKNYAGTGGEPVDELDGICKLWYSMRTCTKFRQGSCEYFDSDWFTSYELSNSEQGITNSNCEQNASHKSSCLYDTCLIDQHFVMQILDVLHNQDIQFDEHADCPKDSLPNKSIFNTTVTGCFLTILEEVQLTRLGTPVSS